MNEQVRIQKVETLSDDWYLLKKTTFEYRRRDGQWQSMSRETYDRGNGATLLLYNKSRRTVVLTRQFRFPTYVNGNDDGWLLETAAGLLDNESPEKRIRKEVAEETGYVLNKVEPVFDAYMSPGSVTERVHFFVAQYEDKNKQSIGGGNACEGEDIEVLELPFDHAFAMIAEGKICDGKTIMLLQHAALHIFVRRPMKMEIRGDQGSTSFDTTKKAGL